MFCGFLIWMWQDSFGLCVKRLTTLYKIGCKQRLRYAIPHPSKIKDFCHLPPGGRLFEGKALKGTIMEFMSHSPAETEALGENLGNVLPAGTVLAYRGDLGAGKTAFTRGLARGLGYTEPVTSPTYTIVNEYLGGRLPLFHFDMYRLTGSDDLWDIGWEDYLERGGICAVEWSENVADAMENALVITIEKSGEQSRKITIEGGENLVAAGL